MPGAHANRCLLYRCAVPCARSRPRAVVLATRLCAHLALIIDPQVVSLFLLFLRKGAFDVKPPVAGLKPRERAETAPVAWLKSLSSGLEPSEFYFTYVLCARTVRSAPSR